VPFPANTLSKPPLHPTPGMAREDTLATSFQMERIRTHALLADLNAEYVSWHTYTKPVSHLTKKEAAALIRFLKVRAQH
jgi:hypothetical protein